MNLKNTCVIFLCSLVYERAVIFVAWVEWGGGLSEELGVNFLYSPFKLC